MPRKEIGAEKILSGEMLGDAKRIQAILADWGMDEAAMERILDEHHAREARVRKSASLTDYPMTGRPASITPPTTHSTQ